MEVVFIWLDGEVACEGANTLKKPGDEVTLEVENLVGREKPGKPESPYSGGVVGSLTGPEMPAFARSRASWSISSLSFSCCRSNSFISSSNLRFCSRMYSICWRFFSNWTESERCWQVKTQKNTTRRATSSLAGICRNGWPAGSRSVESKGRRFGPQLQGGPSPPGIQNTSRAIITTERLSLPRTGDLEDRASESPLGSDSSRTKACSNRW